MKGLMAQLAEPDESTQFIWPACTRFCGTLLKIKRFREMRDLLRRTVASGVYVEKNFLEDDIKADIVAPDVWAACDSVINMLGPLLLLCRLADGQKAVMSKLYGTQLYVRHQMEFIADASPEGSVERKIWEVFLSRWSGLQSDVAQATYCLDPLFVAKSKNAAACIVKLWKLARKVTPQTHALTHNLSHTQFPTSQVMRVTDDDEWTAIHERMAAQLTKFQSKGGDLAHMSSPAAWVNLHDKSALEWWATWGMECPELQQLAIKVVPLMVGSGPAERTWKDVDSILTKKRNRLYMETALDLLYTRTWLRREMKRVSDSELQVYQAWEADLVRSASFYDGTTEPDEGEERPQRIFEDRIEDWELNAIDGRGPGAVIPLGQVRRNTGLKFRLNEKYKGLFFLDKDPNGMCTPTTTLTLTLCTHNTHTPCDPAHRRAWILR